MTRYYTYRKQVPLQHGQKLGYRHGLGYYARGKPTPDPRVTKRSTHGQVLLRSKLVTEELALAKLGIREQGGNNHGPWVRKFLAEVGLPEGYAWCAAFQSWALRKAAGHKLPIESASVAAIYGYAREHGWAVGDLERRLYPEHYTSTLRTWERWQSRPFRGDLACYDFDGDGQYDDHVELVVRVLRLGPTLLLRVVGGNTSSGLAGSQADGDGVWLRTRAIDQHRVGFVRIPGKVKA